MVMEDRSHTADTGAPAFAEVLRDFCQRMELDHAALGVYLPNNEKLHAYSTYPEDFLKHYEENALWENDPTIDCAKNSILPCDLSRMSDHAGFIPIFVDSERFGIPRNGMSFPIHAPDGAWGVFNVLKKCTESEWNRLIARKAPNFHFFAMHLFDSACSSIRGCSAPVGDVLPARLTERELEMLRYVSRGLSSAQISHEMKTSQRITEQTLKAAALKMQAVSPEHAAARAEGLGLF